MQAPFLEKIERPKLTKRQALLAILGATPVLSYGQEFKPGELRYGIQYKPETRVSLLQLNLKLTEPRDGKSLFLVVTVNGKEELTISVDEALEILKGPTPAAAEWKIKEN